ncbi:MAG TPA: CotH kinase family protein [Polyangium sp.]|nr:CotH kinase family protein [Polyangium sp.]
MSWSIRMIGLGVVALATACTETSQVLVGGAGGAAGAGSFDAGTIPEDGGAVDASGDAGPPPRPEIIANPQDEATYLFDDSQVRTYDIQIAPADLALINQDPTTEVYVPASLVFEGQTYASLRVRYKGGYGAFLPPCSGTQGSIGGPKSGKCSMKLAFDQVDPNGRFYGQRKLNFHTMNRDRAMLRDRLGYSLFRDMGIAAPRAVHVRLLINGQLEGLFALVEQVDGRFTRSRFTDGGEGNLYKEIWPIHPDASTYLNALETNEDQMPTVQAMLDFKAAIEADSTQTEAWIDREYTMKYVAIDRVIINDDGMFHWWCTAGGAGNNPGGVGNHNYYWYEATAHSSFWLIPWDFDHSFNTSAFVHIAPAWNATAPCTCTVQPNTSVAQMPASCDPLTRHFIGWKAEYDKYIDAFIAGPFSATSVDAKLDAWISQIRPYVVEAAGLNGAPSESTWNTNVATLRTVIAEARQNRGFPY